METKNNPTCLLSLDAVQVEDLIDALLYARKVGPVGQSVADPKGLVWRLMGDAPLNLSKWEALEILGGLSLAHRKGFKGKDKESITGMMKTIIEYLDGSRSPDVQETIRQIRKQNFRM